MPADELGGTEVCAGPGDAAAAVRVGDVDVAVDDGDELRRPPTVAGENLASGHAQNVGVHGADLVAGSGIPFSDRGSHLLKDVPGMWQLYAVDK